MKATELAPLRLVPVMVTAVPAAPLLGLKLVIAGAGAVTVKVPPAPPPGVM